MNPTKSSEGSVLKWVLWIRNEWIILLCAVVLFLSWELYSKSGLSKWTSLVWAVGCLRAVLTWLSCLIKSCASAGLGAQLPELLPIVWLRRALHQHPGWHPGNSFKNISMSSSKLKRLYKGISPHSEGYQHNRKSDKSLSARMEMGTIKKRSI